MVTTRGERKQGCDHHGGVLKVSVMFLKAVVSTWLLLVKFNNNMYMYMYTHTHTYIKSGLGK